MLTDLLIRNGIVLGPHGPQSADVHLVDGVVAAVGQDLAGRESTIIDAAGAWVGPGFVDLHVHLREPGGEHKEDIASGSAAASAGGYTAVLAMPNTDPAIDAGHLVRHVVNRGREVGLVDVLTSGCITARRAGQELACLDEMWDAGVRIFTDDGDTVHNAALLRRAMEHVAHFPGTIAQHAVDPHLSAGGHMHEGPVSSRLGIQGIPALAEEVIVARDLSLVRLTGASYHVQHVSTVEVLQLIADAKAAGLPVTAEVTPHHLTFDHSDVASMDTTYRMMPPLRRLEDVTALRDALREGIIDAVATDHAPHAIHEKEVPFEHAADGVTGLEWAAAAVTSSAGLGIEAFFDRMSIAPARIAFLSDHGVPITPGSPANIVVFDPGAERQAIGTRSKSVNSPYLGRIWSGEVRATILRGRITYRATNEPRS